MCLTESRKIPQMFSAVPEQEEKCTLSSPSFHSHHAPCPVYMSLCWIALSLCTSVTLRLTNWKETSVIWLFHSFPSFFPSCPPSFCLTFCLLKGCACVCVCVRARLRMQAWMCAKCHCHSWVWRILSLTVFFKKLLKECVVQMARLRESV